MTATAPPRNPFPGLRPFREDEEPLFFGREAHVDSMVDKLGAQGFLAVVGSSGSGKSSLVSCGLIPALHRGLLARTGSGWRVATCRPGNRPMAALAEALAQPQVLPQPPEDDTGFRPVELVEATLQMGKRGLLEAYREAHPLLTDRPNLLVVVDQFEELFRYRALGGDAGGEAATAFVNLLLEAANQPAAAALPVFVVITMRSDFLGECAQFDGLPEAINRGQYLVPRMGREQRRAAIAGPVGVCGASIDPVLLTRLVNEVGDNPDQLSILQHALNRTWARWRDAGGQGPLQAEHYDAVGGMAAALDQHADEALAQLQPGRQQALCESLFRAITDRGTDARGTRRPTRVDTLCAITGASIDALAAVMAPFRDPERAFLMPPHGVPLWPGTVVDISHESLMRVWGALRGWVDEEAESARVYRRLAETAELHRAGQAVLLVQPELQLVTAWVERQHPNAAWAERYRPGFDVAMQFLRLSQSVHAAVLAAEQAQALAEREAEAERQRAALQAEAEAQQSELLKLLNKRWWQVVLPLALVAVAALAWALLDAREQARIARSETDSAVAARATAEQARQLAEAAAAEARRLSAGYERQRQLLESVRGAAPQLEAKVQQSMQAAQAQPVVYLQFADERQRALAEQLRKRLAAAGYQAPAVERVRSVPRRTELRYFRDDDAARGSAAALAAVLRDWGVGQATPRFVTSQTGVATRWLQFELWLALPADTDPLSQLAAQIDADDKARRLQALQTLKNDHAGSPEAVAAVLALLGPDRLDALSTEGRFNALWFLARTNQAAWTPGLAQAGREAAVRLRERARVGVPLGKDSAAELSALEQLLARLPR